MSGFEILERMKFQALNKELALEIVRRPELAGYAQTLYWIEVQMEYEKGVSQAQHVARYDKSGDVHMNSCSFGGRAGVHVVVPVPVEGATPHPGQAQPLHGPAARNAQA